MKFVDYFLDRITMYRLVLYYLLAILAAAVVLSTLGIIHYNPLAIIFTAIYLTIVCLVVNIVFSKVFEAPTNLESVYITALILACVLTPFKISHDLIYLGWAGTLAMASKYILAVNKKHIFNPVAISLVLLDIGLMQQATWWVGNSTLWPVVFIGGLLVMRKIRREDLIFYFFVSAVGVTAILVGLSGGNIAVSVNQLLFHSSLFFFAFVMLTEPLTTPTTKGWQSLYGGLVGIFFPPQFHLAGLYFTPELALVVGNIFSWLVSPKQKLLLKLKEKLQVAPDIIDFLFTSDQKLAFAPGQYLEWTLPQKGTDSRGSRRYFTIASSPTEENLRLGVKFSQNGSSFKKQMLALKTQDKILAGQLSGNFVLPKDKAQKLVFVAGGIGITPFRSMLKFLVDTGERRDIIVFYSVKTSKEFVYVDILKDAINKLGIKVIYTLTDLSQVPPEWQGQVGKIDGVMITSFVPNYRERTFYLSGPQSLVVGFEETLQKLGVASRQIKKDFFPGLV